MDDRDGPPLLPDGLGQWLTRVLPGRIQAISPVAGGGETRGGARVQYDDGTGPRTCFLNFDTRRRNDPRRDQEFGQETGILALLQDSPVRVPTIIAINPECRATLFDWVEGSNNFSTIVDDQQRRAVALDFMRQLAALHTPDLAEKAAAVIPGASGRKAAAQARIERLKSQYSTVTPHPGISFLLHWLLKHVPGGDEPLMLVHGDAGPGNFLFDGPRVTAVLDWEMSHLGDPMEDLAWIACRDLFQPFHALSQCFEEYARYSIHPLSVERIRYYRVLIQTDIVVDVYTNLLQSSRPYDAAAGNILNYYLLHFRTTLRGIAELEGLAMTEVARHDLGSTARTRLHDLALDDLQNTILPFVQDEKAMHRGKSLARLIKLWRAQALVGARYEQDERAELDSLVGAAADEPLETIKLRLSQRIEQGVDLPLSGLLGYLYRTICRETELMRPAMGKLADRQYSDF